MTRPHPTGPEWLAWLAQQLGTTNWVVAARLTPRLKSKGYTVALSQARYSALAAEFDAPQPAPLSPAP